MGLGKDFTEIGVSLLTGAGLGVALMYLFDPDQGNQRRDSLTKSAADLLGETQDTVGERLGGFAATAKNVVGTAIPSLGAAASWLKSSGQSANDYASNAASHAAQYAGQVRDSGRDYAQSAYDRARGALPSLDGHASSQSATSSAASVATTATEIVVAAAIGAGVMYLLDPDRGAARRNMLINQVTGLFNGTAQSAERAASHYADVARGTVRQVREHLQGDNGDSAPASTDDSTAT